MNEEIVNSLRTALGYLGEAMHDDDIDGRVERHLTEARDQIEAALALFGVTP